MKAGQPMKKVKKRNHMLQNIVSKVETECQTMRDEMVIKLQNYLWLQTEDGFIPYTPT